MIPRANVLYCADGPHNPTANHLRHSHPSGFFRVRNAQDHVAVRLQNRVPGVKISVEACNATPMAASLSHYPHL
jgi:hypothetical protein